MKKLFWALEAPTDEGIPATLRIDGEIADDDAAWWYGPDGATYPAAFRQALDTLEGDLIVAINSPGGDVIAASCIYTALREYAGQGHKVTVRVEGWAASAASVVAMAGDEVQMAPTAYLMIHDPWTFASGNAQEMRECGEMLDEIARGIVEAYHTKTGMSRAHIRELMQAETWMSAPKAVKLGFADVVLYQDGSKAGADDSDGTAMQARAAVDRVMARIRAHARGDASVGAQDNAAENDKQRQLLKLLAAI